MNNPLTVSSSHFLEHCKPDEIKIEPLVFHCSGAGNERVNPDQPRVVVHIETNNLFWTAKQMTGFYMNRNGWVKLVTQSLFYIYKHVKNIVTGFLGSVNITVEAKNRYPFEVYVSDQFRIFEIGISDHYHSILTLNNPTLLRQFFFGHMMVCKELLSWYQLLLHKAI